MTAITKALTLMNFPDSYAVSARGQLFHNEINWVFLKSGSKPADALFISYAYKGTNYPLYFKDVSDIFAKEGIKLTDITSGDPANLISTAKAIVVGGGDILTFINKMNSLITPSFNPYQAIKNMVTAGIPYIGWNEGSNIISPKYFTPPAQPIPNGINFSTYQIVCNYFDSAQNRTSIFNYLNNNTSVNILIGQQNGEFAPDGTAVRLEESGSGLLSAGTAPFPVIIRFRIVNGVLEAS